MSKDIVDMKDEAEYESNKLDFENNQFVSQSDGGI
jgi:hypothetical protein